jgi:inner membrane protein
VNGPEHFGIGVTSAGLVLWAAGAVGAPPTLATAATAAAVAGLGSLSPDIDHPRAWIGNRIPLMSMTAGLLLLILPLVLKVASARGGAFAGILTTMLQSVNSLPRWGLLLAAVGAVLLLISVKVTKAVDHRGPTHSLAAAGAATAVVLAICLTFSLAPLYGLLFGLGWLTHLMADAPSPKGLPSLYWPAPDSGPDGRSMALALMLLPILAIGMVGWYTTVRNFSSPTPAAASSFDAPTADAHGAPTAAVALRRLSEADPAIAGAVTHPETPLVAQEGDRTSFTWEYLRQTASNEVVVKSITVTLDSSGQIVGVDAP